MKVRRIAGELSLALEGDFTGSSDRAAEEALGKLLDEVGPGDEPLVLDLGGVGMMDSSGFSRWVQLERQAERGGRALRVRGAAPLIRELFAFADLEEVLLP